MLNRNLNMVSRHEIGMFVLNNLPKPAKSLQKVEYLDNWPGKSTFWLTRSRSSVDSSMSVHVIMTALDGAIASICKQKTAPARAEH